MAFTLADVDRAARLAHLELSDDEREQFRRDLEQITTYMAQLQEIAVEESSNEADPAPESSILSLRPDVATIWPGSDGVVTGAPASKAGFFRVPAVIERKD